MYGRSEFGAEVLPPYEKSVSQLFGIGLWQDWRVGPGGPTFLGRHSDWTIQLSQPRPRDVIALTLADRGWQGFEFSSSGNVAYQMMRHLGGPHQIGLIKNLKLIQFLEFSLPDETYRGGPDQETPRSKTQTNRRFGEKNHNR